MKIIITGGSGFVGRHTIKELKKQGYETFNFEKKVDPRLDINKQSNLEKVIKKGDKILHLAAVARISEAENDPAEAMRTNVGGTLNVIRAANKKGADRVVYSSTGSVYMPTWKVPIRENHPIGGNCVYSFAKGWSEQMFLYSETPYVILRYAHLYGVDKRRGGIGNFLNRMQRGLKPIMYGGFQSNDFLHINDVVQANILSLETDNTDQAYNIGTGEECTIEEAFKLIEKLLGRKVGWEKKQAKKIDTIRFVYDISKARKLLGFEPEYNLEDGLKEIFKKMKLST